MEEAIEMVKNRKQFESMDIPLNLVKMSKWLEIKYKSISI